MVPNVCVTIIFVLTIVLSNVTVSVNCCELSRLKIVLMLSDTAAPNDCIWEENCELRKVVSQEKSGARDVSIGYCFKNEFVNNPANMMMRKRDKDNIPLIQR
jgi:hypothetical protein